MQSTAGVPRARDMRREDLDGVAEVHRNCFPVSLSIFTALSDDILKRFYAQAVEEPECVAVVLEEPSLGRLVGLAFATLKPGFQRRFLRRHFFRFVWGIFIAFAVNAAFRKMMWERFKHVTCLLLKKRNSMLADSSVPAPKGPDAIYTILGVHTQYRGRGNGGRLVDYLAARIFDAGAARITGLIRPDNLASLSLHKRLGWNIKKISTEYVKVWIDRPDLRPRQSR